MEGFYEKNIVIAPSHCDATSKLSLHAMFVLCQDIASEHAELLGIGGAAMAAKGLFWLTVRTRIQVYSRPWMMQQVKVKTWLGKFTERDLRTDRYYRITCGDRLVAEGRTEWAVLRVADQTVVRMREVGIPDVEILEDIVCERPFSRFNTAFTEADEAMEHTVLASDVDMGQHMNNTAYVRAVLDTFTVPELKTMRPAELEICFRSPCYGGDRLTICKKQQEDGWLFAVRRPDGKQAALAQLLLRPETQNS